MIRTCAVLLVIAAGAGAQVRVHPTSPAFPRGGPPGNHPPSWHYPVSRYPIAPYPYYGVPNYCPWYYDGLDASYGPQNVPNIPPPSTFTTEPRLVRPTPAVPTGPTTLILNPESTLAPGTARITLEVPNDAEVLVQGKPLKQAGPRRVFDTAALNGTNEYQIVVKWIENGAAKEQKLNVPVAPGARPTVRVIP